jgi:hypothetical protein
MRSASAPRPGADESERGTATAELALALPTLVVILAVGLYALAAVSVQGRCATAAAAGARAAARGDEASTVRTHALAGLPHGSSVELGRADPSFVTVRVTAPLPVPVGLDRLVHARPLVGTADAADEAAPGIP